MCKFLEKTRTDGSNCNAKLERLLEHFKKPGDENLQAARTFLRMEKIDEDFLQFQTDTIKNLQHEIAQIHPVCVQPILYDIVAHIAARK